MGRVIPCNGTWFAVFFGANLSSKPEPFLYVKQVCAWKNVNTGDNLFMSLEPVVWLGKDANSCQNWKGFRGCVTPGDVSTLARLLRDPDIKELPAEAFDEVCLALYGMERNWAKFKEDVRTIREGLQANANA